MTEYTTELGSLDSYRKGGVHVIDDDPRSYVFSNVFEVARQSAPFERVCVAKNMEYVVEIMRAEGAPPWFTAGHDEFALCLDGTVEVTLARHAGAAPEGDGARRRAGRVAHGADQGRARPSGAAAGGRGLPDRGGAAERRPVPIDRRTAHCPQMGGHLPDRLKGGDGGRTMAARTTHEATAPDDYPGYRTFRIGGFDFRRDEYFTHIAWPGGTHLMPVGAFLRALVRTDANGYPVNRMFADVSQEEPEIEVAPGFEGEVRAFNLFAYLSRSDVTWNPSVCTALRDSLFCPPSEEFTLPVEHGNDRVEWFIQLSDEIVWEVKDKESGDPRAVVTMRAGDVACMPADIRHQGFSPKRSMLLVWENASPALPEMVAKGEAPIVPVRF